jgi:DNA modification methylase
VSLPINQILVGDVLTRIAEIPDESVQCCITSPPYWGLRDYGVPGQLGLESTPEEYVARMVEVFREVRRVLRSDGTLWLDMGDSYATGAGSVRRCPGGGFQGRDWTGPTTQPNRMPIAGLKPKDLVGIPWRLAFALQADGWWLRSDIIWSKPNPMPESVTDRPTKAHEYVFLMAKSEKYHYDAAAIRTPFSGETKLLSFETMDYSRRDKYKTPDGWNTGPGAHGSFHPNGREKGKTDKQRGHGRRHDGFNARWDKMEREEQLLNGANKRTVWTIATEAYPEAHFATFPEKLVEPCILAGCPEGGLVLDPFMGAGTVALVALKARRNFIGIELSEAYAKMARERIAPEIAQGRIV